MTALRRLRHRVAHWRKKRTIRRRAQEAGEAFIRLSPRTPTQWTKFENRTLIRLNRICEGLPPFFSDKQNVRWVAQCPEIPSSLRIFGNIA